MVIEARLAHWVVALGLCGLVVDLAHAQAPEGTDEATAGGASEPPARDATDEPTGAIPAPEESDDETSGGSPVNDPAADEYAADEESLEVSTNAPSKGSVRAPPPVPLVPEAQAPGAPLEPSRPEPDQPAATERRSVFMMVTGIVMVSMGGASIAAGIIYLEVEPARGGLGPLSPGFLVPVFAGLALGGIGAPLIVAGAKRVPGDDSQPPRSAAGLTLQLGPTGIEGTF